MKRLYVLVDNSLEPIYACVQGGHAVAQWLLEHPDQNWNNSYLIYLSADIKDWIDRLGNSDFTLWHEPDLNGAATSIAMLSDGKMFKRLKTIKVRERP